MTTLAVQILRVLRAALDAADREWGVADSDDDQCAKDFPPQEELLPGRVAKPAQEEAPAAPVAEEATPVQEEVPSRRRRRTETTEENPAPVEPPQEEVPSRRSRRAAAAVEAPVIVQPPFASIPADKPISDVELSRAASLAAAHAGVMKTMALLQVFGIRDVKEVPQEKRAELLRQLAELQP